MKNLLLILTGAVGGIAFVLACSSMTDGVNAGRDASAAPSDCDVWQVADMSFANVNFDDNTGRIPRAMDVIVSGGPVAVWELPAGWEPFGQTDITGVLARRCKP